MGYGDLRQEGQEEDSVEGRPVTLIFRTREVAGSGAKKDLRDW